MGYGTQQFSCAYLHELLSVQRWTIPAKSPKVCWPMVSVMFSVTPRFWKGHWGYSGCNKDSLCKKIQYSKGESLMVEKKQLYHLWLAMSGKCLFMKWNLSWVLQEEGILAISRWHSRWSQWNKHRQVEGGTCVVKIQSSHCRDNNKGGAEVG